MGAAFFVGMTASKKIGELNGPWALLLKGMLGAGPFILAWMVWATTEIYSLRAEQQVMLATQSLEVQNIKESISEIKGIVHDLADTLDDRK